MTAPQKAMIQRLIAVVEIADAELAMEAREIFGTKPRSTRDTRIDTLVQFLSEQIGRSPDGSVQTNRRDCYNLLNRTTKDHPDHDPVKVIKAIIVAGRQDPFHKRNLTNFRYLYNHGGKIIESRKSSDGRLDDAGYDAAVNAAIAARFGGQAGEAH